MLKQLVLLKRRDGMSMEEFIHYYETHHARIGESLMKKARRYVRRYVRPEPNPITGETEELDFDVIMEIWWDCRADLDEMVRQLEDESIYRTIYEDEEKLFSSHSHRVFSVEEYDSALPRGITC